MRIMRSCFSQTLPKSAENLTADDLLPYVGSLGLEQFRVKCKSPPTYEEPLMP